MGYETKYQITAKLVVTVVAALCVGLVRAAYMRYAPGAPAVEMPAAAQGVRVLTHRFVPLDQYIPAAAGEVVGIPNHDPLLLVVDVPEVSSSTRACPCSALVAGKNSVPRRTTRRRPCVLQCTVSDPASGRRRRCRRPSPRCRLRTAATALPPSKRARAPPCPTACCRHRHAHGRSPRGPAGFRPPTPRAATPLSGGRMPRGVDGVEVGPVDQQHRHYPGGVVQRRRMQRGRTVVRTRVNVRSATEQHPHHPAGRLERRHVQGGRAVVRPRAGLGSAVEQEDRRRRRVARRGPMQRGIAPGVVPPDAGAVVQQHPRHRNRVPPRRRVQRRDALRGRRPDVSPARRENGRSRAAAARGRVVQRGRRCRIGNVRARAALEQNRRGLARRRLRRCGAGSRRSGGTGGTGGIGPGRSSSACSATPGRAARRRSAAARPTALRPPAAPGRRRPVQGGRAVQVRPPVCRPPSTRTTCGRDGRRVPPAR